MLLQSGILTSFSLPLISVHLSNRHMWNLWKFTSSLLLPLPLWRVTNKVFELTQAHIPPFVFIERTNDLKWATFKCEVICPTNVTSSLLWRWVRSWEIFRRKWYLCKRSNILSQNQVVMFDRFLNLMHRTIVKQKVLSVKLKFCFKKFCNYSYILFN